MRVSTRVVVGRGRSSFGGGASRKFGTGRARPFAPKGTQRRVLAKGKLRGVWCMVQGTISVTGHFFLVFECPPSQSQERVTKKILVASIRDRYLSILPSSSFGSFPQLHSVSGDKK